MRVDARLARILAFGNLDDHKNLKDGVFELRFLMHSEIRIYFDIEEQNKIIFLLVGGCKSSLLKDIAMAKRFWKKHKGA